MKDKKEKSRNPHGYWIFRWRRRWDSNPRDLAVYLISSQARYDHFDTPPCVFFARFSLFLAAGSETHSERTDGKNYGIFNFRAREKPYGTGLCAIRNAQSQRRFRVRTVMTTSIPLHGILASPMLRKKERIGGENKRNNSVFKSQKT